MVNGIRATEPHNFGMPCGYLGIKIWNGSNHKIVYEYVHEIHLWWTNIMYLPSLFRVVGGRGDHLHFTSTSKLCFALSVILHHILRLKSYSQLYESADISKPQLNANGNVNVTNYGLLKVVAAIERPVVNRNDK